MAKVKIGKGEYLDLNKEKDVRMLDDIFKESKKYRRARVAAWGAVSIFGIAKLIKHFSIYERNYGGKAFTEEILDNIKDE